MCQISVLYMHYTHFIREIQHTDSITLEYLDMIFMLTLIISKFT